MYRQTCFLLAETYHISPKIIIWTICCLFEARYYMIVDGDHLGNWRPYWNDPNFRIVPIISTVHSACSKHRIYYQNDPLRSSAAIFWQKNEDFRIAHGGHLEKWRPYWNFVWPTLFSCRVTPVEYVYQICCLYHNLKESYEICNYLFHY